MSKPKIRKQKMLRRCQLFCEAVSVCCPWCGEPQPNKDGSEMWTPSDFTKAADSDRKRITCVACDEVMWLMNDVKASFRP